MPRSIFDIIRIAAGDKLQGQETATTEADEVQRLAREREMSADAVRRLEQKLAEQLARPVEERMRMQKIAAQLNAPTDEVLTVRDLETERRRLKNIDARLAVLKQAKPKRAEPSVVELGAAFDPITGPYWRAATGIKPPTVDMPMVLPTEARIPTVAERMIPPTSKTDVSDEKIREMVERPMFLPRKGMAVTPEADIQPEAIKQAVHEHQQAHNEALKVSAPETQQRAQDAFDEYTKALTDSANKLTDLLARTQASSRERLERLTKLREQQVKNEPKFVDNLPLFLLIAISGGTQLAVNWWKTKLESWRALIAQTDKAIDNATRQTTAEINQALLAARIAQTPLIEAGRIAARREAEAARKEIALANIASRERLAEQRNALETLRQANVQRRLGIEEFLANERARHNEALERLRSEGLTQQLLAVAMKGRNEALKLEAAVRQQMATVTGPAPKIPDVQAAPIFEAADTIRRWYEDIIAKIQALPEYKDVVPPLPQTPK